MPLFARELRLTPDVLTLAASLRDRPDFALLRDATGQGPSYIACDSVGVSQALDPEPSLGLNEQRDPLSRVPRWIGVLPYECRRSLERERFRVAEKRPEPELVTPQWRRYAAVVEVTRGVRVVGDRADRVEALCEWLQKPSGRGSFAVTFEANQEPAGVHEDRIRHALELIAAGDLYQVNLARRFELKVEGHPVDAVLAMGKRGDTAHSAALRFGKLDFVSTSPELFLQLDERGRLTTCPIKGTRPRGRDAADEARLIQELQQSEKERAELNMIIDVERNDLGRVAQVGSVRLASRPQVVICPTVLHRVATIHARMRPGVTRTQLLEALLPSGSVTGAPKVRAMEIIAALESRRRGIYTGAYGSLSHAGGLRLSMAIRVLSACSGRGNYWAGGGIVADSDPRLEVIETEWKAEQLLALKTAPWR